MVTKTFSTQNGQAAAEGQADGIPTLGGHFPCPGLQGSSLLTHVLSWDSKTLALGVLLPPWIVLCLL